MIYKQGMQCPNPVCKLMDIVMNMQEGSVLLQPRDGHYNYVYVQLQC